MSKSFWLQEVVAERKAARKQERDALARGEMPESLGKWKVCGGDSNLQPQLGCPSSSEISLQRQLAQHVFSWSPRKPDNWSLHTLVSAL